MGKKQITSHGSIIYLDAEKFCADESIFQYSDSPRVGLPAPASALLRLLRWLAGGICAVLVLASLVFSVLSLFNADGISTAVFAFFGILFGIPAFFCLKDR